MRIIPRSLALRLPWRLGSAPVRTGLEVVQLLGSWALAEADTQGSADRHCTYGVVRILLSSPSARPQ